MTGALSGWDVRARLHELPVPTLVLRGAYDMSTETISGALTEGIAGARAVVFGKSSHTPVLEETERYLDVVREFIYAVEAR
jgi:pimeloyl-ACP methyl ester carboxylesterase